MRLLPRPDVHRGFQNPKIFLQFFKKFCARPFKKRNGKFFGFELRWKRRRKQYFFLTILYFWPPLPQPTPARATLYSLGFYSRDRILRDYEIVIRYKQQFVPKLCGISVEHGNNPSLVFVSSLEHQGWSYLERDMGGASHRQRGVLCFPQAKEKNNFLFFPKMFSESTKKWKKKNHINQRRRK